MADATDFGSVWYMGTVYAKCKVYGPYTRKDGREHVVILFPDGIRRTVSYPKYLVELHLNRYLGEEETVDHIDGDFSNNDLKNLRVLTRKQHSYEDARRLVSQEFVCPECGTTFFLEGKRLHDALRRMNLGHYGPFCSKSCAGRYSRKVQLGIIKKLTPHNIPTKTYHTLKQSLYEETHKVDGPKTGKP